MALTRIRKRGIRSDAVNEHVSFTNIVDTGTEGTKLAAGTTAQRGSTPGQFRYNSTTSKFEGRNAAGSFISLEATPSVTGVTPTTVESDAGGNVTFTITGTNFITGDTAKFVGTDATVVTAATTTVDSSTQITAVAPRSSFANAKEPYDVKVTSTGGLSGQLDNQINVDTAPTWNTAAGSLGTLYDNISANHFTLSATDADGDTIAYTETGATNITGAGLALNSSTGIISGDATDVGSNTTVSFTGRATAGARTTDRAFSFIVSPALGTSANPATSAKQLYDAGYTTNGVYYFNNVWTGNQDKQAYARFDVWDAYNTNKLHLQRVDFGHLSAHAIRNYANSGSVTTTRYSGNATDLDVDNGSTYKYDASSSTGGGASSMVDTGLPLTTWHGYTMVTEYQMTSLGDSNNNCGIQMAEDASTNGGNYGHVYNGDYDVSSAEDTDYLGFFLQATKFTDSGSAATLVEKNPLGGQFKASTNANLWSTFYSDTGTSPNWSTDTNRSTAESAQYVGIRFRGWADHTSNRTAYYAFWMGINGS